MIETFRLTNGQAAQRLPLCIAQRARFLPSLAERSPTRMATVAVSDSVNSEFRMNTVLLISSSRCPKVPGVSGSLPQTVCTTTAELLEDRRCALSDSLSGDKPAHPLSRSGGSQRLAD